MSKAKKKAKVNLPLRNLNPNSRHQGTLYCDFGDPADKMDVKARCVDCGASGDVLLARTVGKPPPARMYPTPDTQPGEICFLRVVWQGGGDCEGEA